MAQVIQGDPSTFDSLFMGEMHPGTQQFLQNQIEAPTNVLNQAGQSFFHKGQQLWQQLADSRSVRRIQAARRAIGSIWQDDVIKQLSSIAELQWAGPTMQRWIMANPTVRRMYHDQEIEGYEGSYVDYFPGDIGASHYDYRQAVNGLVIENEGQDEPEWSATTYYDDESESEQPLHLFQQSDIYQTWLAVNAHIIAGDDDPTSRYNASL